MQKHLTDKNTLQEKLSKAREDREQLLTRIGILEAQLSQKNQATNIPTGSISPEMVEKVRKTNCQSLFSLFSFYLIIGINFLTNDNYYLYYIFVSAATLLWKISPHGKP